MSQINSSLTPAQPSDEITLRRGKRQVTYEKVPDQFAIRLKKDQPASMRAEDRTVDVAKANMEHTSGRT
jgi:hypothetical protein